MKNIIIFASGGGSNFKVIYNNIENNKISNARVSLLVSNNSQSKAVEFAKSNGIDTFILNKTRFPDISKYILELDDKLTKMKPDLIVLAGYMKLIPQSIVAKFEGKIINIHPAVLPQFGGKGMYGINVHKAVINSGIKETAVTIHYVNEKYDEGQIIYEQRIKVSNQDTAESLSKRVLYVEHEVYSKVINKLLNGINTYD